MDRTRSKGEVNLSVVNITMDGREVLRLNVKEAEDVEGNYIPMKKMSLYDMMVDERSLAPKIATKNKSFVEMFEDRIQKLKGKRKCISVTIDVKIRAEKRDADYEEQNKNKDFTDEYNISNKKVIRQIFISDDSYVKKNMDPLLSM